jgi:hypothetical protein
MHYKKSQLFLIGNFGKKTSPYGFFAPMSNLTKVPFWTSQFGLDHFDLGFLVSLFDWVFFTNVFLLNHCDKI